jgi:hypothetical protein
MKKPLFRQKSMERISTPEQLTDYIRVTRPGVWIVLAAAVLLLVSLLVWGVYGALPDAVAVNGVSSGGVVTCYIENPSNISSGMKAEVDGIAGKVTSVGDIPLSGSEVSDIYHEDYTLKMLNIGDWNYAVTISAPGAPDGLVKVVIEGEAVHPISFLTDGVAS